MVVIGVLVTGVEVGGAVLAGGTVVAGTVVAGAVVAGVLLFEPELVEMSPRPRTQHVRCCSYKQSQQDTHRRSGRPRRRRRRAGKAERDVSVA